MKNYIPETGVPVDGSFVEHKRNCRRCASGKLSELCLEGSVLWKRENAVKRETKRAPDGEYHTTKAHAKELMRYKQ